MVSTITGRRILDHARQVCRRDGPVYLAVAYWGSDAAEALGISNASTNLHVVLNVTHGGTNPIALAALMHMLPGRVRCDDALHAKIYAAETLAIVGSANASANGLNLEDAGHTEAAVVLTDAEVGPAFDLARTIFDAASPAREADIETCKKLFGTRGPAASVGGSGGARNPVLGSVLSRQDLFGAMPFLFTVGEADRAVRADAFDQARQALPGSGAGIRDSADGFDFYQFEIASDYLGKTCVEIYLDREGRLSAHLVCPFWTGIGATFVQRLDWNLLGEKGVSWRGKRRKLTAEPPLLTAHPLLSSRCRGGAFLRGWDLYAQVSPDAN